jgi:hypothetical protein
VELLATVAVICLAIRGQRKLYQNAVDIGREFKLPNGPEVLIRHRASQMARVGWLSQVKELIWFPIHSVSTLAADSNDTSLSPVEHLIARYLYRGRWQARTARVEIATIVAVLALGTIDQQIGTSYIEVGVLRPSGYHAREVATLVSLLSLVSIQFLVFWVADAMLLSRAFILELSRSRREWPAASLERAQTEFGLCAGTATTWLNLRLVAARTERVANLVWYPSLVIAAMAIAAFTVEFGPFSFASNPVSLSISTLILIAAAFLLRRSAESLRSRAIVWIEDYRSLLLSPQSDKTSEVSQLDRLIDRVAALRDGAFAPYSQQPLVKALLVPAATYGSNLLLEHFGLTGL